MGGVLQGVDNAPAFRIAAYLVAPTGLAYSKPYPGDAAIIQQDGSWRIAGWATSPQYDPAFVRMVFVVVTLGTPILPVVGGPLPAYGNGVLTTLSVPRTFIPGNGNGGDNGGGNQPPPPPPAVPVLTILRFPAVGSIDPISGVVSGLPAAGAFRVAVYVGHLDRASGFMDWWYKTTAAVNEAGRFTAAWAAQQQDAHADLFQLYVIPAAVPVPVVLGGRLPATLENAAVAKGRYMQGYVSPVAGASVDTSSGDGSGLADGTDGASSSGGVSGLAAGLIVAGAMVGAVLAAAGVAFVQRRRAHAEAQNQTQGSTGNQINGQGASSSTGAGRGRSSTPAGAQAPLGAGSAPSTSEETAVGTANQRAGAGVGPTPKSRKTSDRQRPAPLDGNSFAAVPQRTPGAAASASNAATPLVASRSTAAVTGAGASAAALHPLHPSRRKQK